MKTGTYIAIEGPIGAGKSTLAARLAHTLSARILAEAPQDNPFLGAFYEHPDIYALPAQLYFLLQRVHQVDDLRQSELFADGCVADFMFEKDPLFARLTLSEQDFALYRDIHARLAVQVPTPDYVIYLHAPVPVLAQRVARRDRLAERCLSMDYLARVAAAYRAFFSAFDTTRLIRVDTVALDLVGREADYRALVAALSADARWQSLGEAGHKQPLI